MDKLDIKAVREAAVKRAEEDLRYAKDTEERHNARLALVRARRAIAKKEV